MSGESELYLALDKLIQGIRLIGDAVTSLITYVLAAVGVQVPDIAVRIGAVILVILTLYKLGNVVSKIVLYAMIFLLITFLAGLIPAVGELLGNIIV